MRMIDLSAHEMSRLRQQQADRFRRGVMEIRPAPAHRTAKLRMQVATPVNPYVELAEVEAKVRRP
jgi:hypothetical protein